MEERYLFIIEAIKEAGERLLLLMNKDVLVSSKEGDYRNIVTSADLEINNFLINKIKAAFPEEQIYSEETMGKNMAGSFWSIDPIDGTSNFARRIPHFAIVLTYLEKNIPIMGAIHNPITGELFSFKKGEGAFLNGAKMAVSNVKNIKEAYTILHIGRQEEVRDWGINLHRRLLTSAKKTINLASSALDICFLASGRVDAVIYSAMTTLDVATAIGLLREAGGEVYDAQGLPAQFNQEPQKIIGASTRELFNEIVSLN